MTYAVAWLWQGHAYLVCRPLRANNRPADIERTSVNEAQRQVGARQFVEESALKIVELRPGVACAIAGNSALGFAVVHFLREHWGSLPLVELLAAASASLGPFTADRSTV